MADGPFRFAGAVARPTVELADHVALVTGGNSGIGLGIAYALGVSGAAVCIWGRRERKNAVAVRLLEAAGIHCCAFCCDVTDEAQVDDAFRTTLAHFHRVDSCFANAGVDGYADFVKMTSTEWRRVLCVNLDGVFLTLRAAARHMVARGGGGSLVAISSVAAVRPSPGRLHYAASKAGVLAVVRGLALELGPYAIRVNAVLPGAIATDLQAKRHPASPWQERKRESVPLGRFGRPEDLGALAVYLAGSGSSYHTGDTITVDGGFSTL